MSLALFGDVRSLLLALHHSSREERFPKYVQETTGSGGRPSWAIPVASEKEFARLATEIGITVSFPASPPVTKQVLLASLLASVSWVARDWFRDNFDRPSDGGVLQTADLRDNSPRYILGARTRSDAERLLETLTSFVVTGIRAVPIVARADSPFQFYWAVTSDAVALPVLQSAARAWWHPSGSREFRVFREWPYDLDIPDRLLERIDWDRKAGLVLLGRDEPSILVLGAEDFETTSAPLERVADLRPGTIRTFNTVATVEQKFRVDLRLVHGESERRLAERIADFEKEIEAKKKILEAMKAEQDEEGDDEDLMAEPLYLYCSAPSEVPDQLRRLLIEWSGQPNELGQLQYQKVSGASLVKDLWLEGGDVHIVTTLAALAGNGTDASESVSNVGSRLCDYCPLGGGLIQFDLLRAWARHGIHLFVPHGHNLVLYPRLQATAEAAGKLADALLDSQPGRYAALLTPADRGQLTAWRLDMSRFVPFADAFGWNCAVCTSRIDEDLRKQHAEQLASGFAARLVASLDQAVSEGASAKLSEKKQLLMAELDAEGKEFEARQQAAREVEQSTDTLLRILGELDATLVGAGAATNLLARDQAGVVGLVKSVGSHLDRFDALASTLASLDTKLRETTAAIERMRRHLRSRAKHGQDV
jgi:hypothetical protein